MVVGGSPLEKKVLVFLKVSGGSEFLFTYLNLPLSHAPLLGSTGRGPS